MSKVRYAAKQRFSVPSSAVSLPALSSLQPQEAAGHQAASSAKSARTAGAADGKTRLTPSVGGAGGKKHSVGVASNLERVTEQNASSAESLTEVKTSGDAAPPPRTKLSRQPGNSRKIGGSLAAKTGAVIDRKKSYGKARQLEDNKSSKNATSSAVKKEQAISDKENSVPNDIKAVGGDDEDEEVEASGILKCHYRYFRSY